MSGALVAPVSRTRKWTERAQDCGCPRSSSPPPPDLGDLVPGAPWTGRGVRRGRLPGNRIARSFEERRSCGAVREGIAAPAKGGRRAEAGSCPPSKGKGDSGPGIRPSTITALQHGDLVRYPMRRSATSRILSIITGTKFRRSRRRIVIDARIGYSN